ncbi:squalene/phytoene synthase family protein [Candidatus Thiosymbion oneisti]|uniref:squalene/phytoene synthase family protein n=1 Tax=Candidatus Thiosymbion oneisti TaxID=589554 RepID=UPI000B0E9EDE|nr:squalene/phytoene synthase family protein [Candidatus Thiosymbion oneisti]
MAGEITGPAPDEWRFPNQATPVGSSAYYSLRFAPRELRDDLAVLSAWRHQVRAIPDRVSDPGLARIKLQWWREELERTFAGTPHHPLSRVLGPVLEQHGLPQAPFTDIADQVEAEILCRQPGTEADLDAACERDLGAFFELIAHCHGLSDADVLRAARRLGGFCARVYLIRDSGVLARRGRALFPSEQLGALGLSHVALGRREYRDRLPELLAPAADRAKAKLTASDPNRGLPVCIRVRVCILASLLEELAGAGFAVTDQRIGLTPLRKLWLAWRENRRTP